AHTIAHALNANVVSVRYGNAASLVPPVNRLEFDWSSGKKLEQSVVVEKGKPRAAVDATYDQAKDRTTIVVVKPRGVATVVRPGLVLLRVATARGTLTIEY